MVMLLEEALLKKNIIRGEKHRFQTKRKGMERHGLHNERVAIQNSSSGRSQMNSKYSRIIISKYYNVGNVQEEEEEPRSGGVGCALVDFTFAENDICQSIDFLSACWFPQSSLIFTIETSN